MSSLSSGLTGSVLLVMVVVAVIAPAMAYSGQRDQNDSGSSTVGRWDQYSWPDLPAWKKYAGNPVMSTGSTGAFDDRHVACPTVVSNGATYHMWYCGVSQTTSDDWSRGEIGYANSTDGKGWVRNGKVLAKGSPGDCDCYGLAYPSVVFDGSKYRLWYSAWSSSGPSSLRIAYATSTDGRSWTKHGVKLDVSTSGFDSYYIFQCWVLYNGTNYNMWYTGSDGATRCVGMATSSDGENWTKSGRIAINGSFMNGGCSVMFDLGKYRMWYDAPDGKGGFNTRYAVSDNGMNWTDQGLALDVGSSGAFDDECAFSCAPVRVGNESWLWYTGYESAARIGLAMAKMNMTVVNEPPYVKKSTADFSMPEGGAISGDNLDDIFGDADSILDFTSAGGNHINVTIGAGPPHQVNYTAQDLWHGKEMITFKATDGQFNVSTTVNVTVFHVNHLPVAKQIPDISFPEDSVYSSLDLSLYFSDLDGFDTLNFSSENAGGHIAVVIAPSANVTLTPKVHWFGHEPVVFAASDGIAPAVSVQVNMTVAVVDYVPEVFGALENITLDEESRYTTSKSLISVFRDVNGDPLNFSADYEAAKLTIDIKSDGSVIIMPQKDVFGTFPLVFKATDPGGKFAVYTINITVLNVNDAPVIDRFEPSNENTINILEGGNLTFNITASDADADLLKYAWSLDMKAQDSQGPKFSYFPDYGSGGTHIISVIVTDGKAMTSLVWSVNVTDVNRRPGVSITSPTNASAFKSGAMIVFSAGGADPDGDTLTFNWTSDGKEIGSSADFTRALPSGTHKIRVEVSDGRLNASAEVTITVNKVAAPSKSTPGFGVAGLLAVLGTMSALFGKRMRCRKH